MEESVEICVEARQHIQTRVSLQQHPEMMIDMSEARETTQDNNLCICSNNKSQESKVSPRTAFVWKPPPLATLISKSL